MTREQLTRHSYHAVADDVGLTVEQVGAIVRWLSALPQSLDTDRAATLEDVATVVGASVDQVDHVARALVNG